MSTKATITSKGRLTIPKAIRDRFDLRPGDQVFFDVESNGELKLGRSSISRDDFLTSVRPSKITLTNEEIEEAIANGATDGDL